MSDIPGDIRELANGVMDDIAASLKTYLTSDRLVEVGDEGEMGLMFKPIAMAILAERQRCSGITKSFPGLQYAILNPQSLPPMPPKGSDSPTLETLPASGPHSTGEQP